MFLDMFYRLKIPNLGVAGSNPAGVANKINKLGEYGKFLVVAHLPPNYHGVMYWAFAPQRQEAIQMVGYCQK